MSTVSVRVSREEGEEQKMASNLRRGRSAFGAPATPTDSLGNRKAVCSRAVPHRPGRRRASSTTGVLDLTRAWPASPSSDAKVLVA